MLTRHGNRRSFPIAEIGHCTLWRQSRRMAHDARPAVNRSKKTSATEFASIKISSSKVGRRPSVRGGLAHMRYAFYFEKYILASFMKSFGAYMGMDLTVGGPQHRFLSLWRQVPPRPPSVWRKLARSFWPSTTSRSRIGSLFEPVIRMSRRLSRYA